MIFSTVDELESYRGKVIMPYDDFSRYLACAAQTPQVVTTREMLCEVKDNPYLEFGSDERVIFARDGVYVTNYLSVVVRGVRPVITAAEGSGRISESEVIKIQSSLAPKATCATDVLLQVCNLLYGDTSITDHLRSAP